MGSSEEKSEGLITGINVTPLVDVVLVLLIIFMATAPLIVKRAMNVNVPRAATGEKASVSLQVTIASDRSVFLEKSPLTLAELALALKNRQSMEPDVRVTLAAEGGLPYKDVVEVLDTIRSAGVKKVALEVKPQPAR